MGETVRKLTLSFEEYLALEEGSPERHELVEGVPYAMAGASETHNLLVVNLVALLRSPALRRAAAFSPRICGFAFPIAPSTTPT